MRWTVSLANVSARKSGSSRTGLIAVITTMPLRLKKTWENATVTAGPKLVVTASDASPTAIARARREAMRLGVACKFVVADLRRLRDSVKGRFDLAIAFDNALPHIMTDEELDAALGELAEALRPRGTLLASVRDYDALLKERPQITPPRLIETEDERRVLFQVWDWAEDSASYRPTLYIVRHRKDSVETLAFPTHYRALTRAELNAALKRVGFRTVTWFQPSKSRYYQPVVAASLK